MGISNHGKDGSKRKVGKDWTGDTPDISEWTDFTFYDRVWFWDAPKSEDNPVLGRWLGISHRVGAAMCYWVVKSNGQIMSHTTFQHVTELELRQISIMEKVKTFDSELDTALGDDVYYDDDFAEFTRTDVPGEEDMDDDMALIDEQEETEFDSSEGFNQFINAELLLPHGDGHIKARVMKRTKDSDSNPIGRHHNNLL